MSIVIDMTISLDGFVTAPGADAEHGLGVGGEALHDWVFADNDVSRQVLATAVDRTGAVLMGRRTFDIVDAVWSDEMGYGAEAGAGRQPSCVVVTHEAPSDVQRPAQFTIVTDGLEVALDRARTLAGDRDVFVMGGGALCSQLLAAGLGDELSVHIAPLVLGGGTPFFPVDARVELLHRETISTPEAIHVTYDIQRTSPPESEQS